MNADVVERLKNAAAYPEKLKQLRACLTCKLIKTNEQFKLDKCDNCDFDDWDVMGYTTPTFKGTIAMLKPTQSWVARWQKQEKLKSGLYAIQVFGTTAAQEIAEEDEDM